VITLTEYQAIQEGKIEEEQEVCLMEDHEEDEVVVEPDEGDLLAIRRALNV